MRLYDQKVRGERKRTEIKFTIQGVDRDKQPNSNALRENTFVAL